MSPLINLARLSQNETSAPVAKWLASNDFRRAVLEIDASVELRAKLSLSLLKHVALDARHGVTADAFQHHGDGKTMFMLHLFRMHNFIGPVTLDTDSALCQELQQAIERNLKGRMFKAARLTQRIMRPAQGHQFCQRARVQARARLEASEQVRLGQNPSAKPLSSGSKESQVSGMVSDMYLAYRRRALQRVQNVSEHACDEVFQPGAYDGMLAFTLRYIAPTALRGA
ncbi:hypothetical protein [Burkholderia cenocepacia]|uniref:hypothetical protein n=1 Tax=Burkholderia cenocepacia TaxID=95486 RepID=UPI000AD7301A|nr:hypothetical protein [Burkholderia cenocepacia]